jgi:hypothetical protein
MSSSPRRNAIVACLASALALLPALNAPGQTVLLFEDFENMGNVPIGGWGPQGLINEGWTFINNSQPIGTIGYVSGCCWGSVIPPLSGTGYLASYQDAAAGGNPSYSNWAILPAVANQQAGDVFSFYTISSDTSPWDDVSLQVRYSPSGGSNVGVGAGSVGDFTQVLLDIPQMPNYNMGTANGWTYWEFVLPGPGRIALRQYGNSSMYFGVEDLKIATAAPPGGPYPEDFENLGGTCGEGPCALVNGGWIFHDQSSPSTAAAWEPNEPLDTIESQNGFGHIKSESVAGGGAQSGGVNTWAILPASGLAPGDTISFFVTGSIRDGGSFEVRYSPTGLVNTGSGVNDVGDFTQALVHLTALTHGSWQLVTAQVPGSGRIALRFHNPAIDTFSGTQLVAVDSMAVNAVPATPPLPQPGQTVTWTAKLNPINIDFDLAIPTGATVNVEPGVTINISNGHAITVAGEFHAQGTTANRISINGWAPMFPAFLDDNGHTEFDHVILNNGRFEPTFASNCSATASVVDARRVVACNFTNAGISVVDDNLAVEDSTFSGGGISLLRGSMHIDNVAIDNSALSVTREDASQTLYLNNISITNTTAAPALRLDGWSFALGPNNQLTNNKYPVEMSGGLAPGSVVPATGNINNFVHLKNSNGPTGYDELPALSVPYLLSDLYLPGLGLDVLPGARFVGMPGAELWEQFHTMRLLGTPDQPITFQGFSPGAGAWHGIQWSLSDGSKAEYLNVRDAQFGMLVDDTIMPIDSCTLQGNVYGLRATNSSLAILRKNQFLSNNVGVSASPMGSWDMNGQTNPNSIQGNGIGAEEDDPNDTRDARYNWWGHPTGPTSPTNPGGQGDSAGANILVLPYRTAPPDFADTPPLVRMQEIARVLETNAPLILHWDASDDGTVVSQRILFSELGLLSDAVVLHDNLPGSQRSALVQAPASNFFHKGYFIVQATDDAGQIGNDLRYAPIVPDTSGLSGSFTFPAGLEGPFVTGEDIPAFAYITGNNYAILLDDMNEGIDLGAGVLTIDAPWASTNVARFLAVGTNGKRFFSNYFTVRPPEFFGDAAPTIQLLSPTTGSFSGGATVNIAWAAADDEAVRDFDIMASYDGQRSWHYIRKGLPASATSFAWKLPPLQQSVPNVFVRVIVHDLRYQATAATSSALTLTPGSRGTAGDADGDGAVDVDDLLAVILGWGACGSPCPADVSGDGIVNVDDLIIVILNWG